jgi:hypothetical protein
MTKDRQIAFIREKCIEANPDIENPELRKGFLCLVSDKRTSTGERYITSYDVAIHDDSLEPLQAFRPIRLADVLLAIPNQYGQKLSTGYISGDRINVSLEADTLDVVAYWNLRKDDLTEQSDECINFLYELLK